LALGDGEVYKAKDTRLERVVAIKVLLNVDLCGFRDGVQQLFYRPMDAFEATPVPGTEGAASIAVSPDCEWAAGEFGGSFTKASLLAGACLELSDQPMGQGTCWLPNFEELERLVPTRN